MLSVPKSLNRLALEVEGWLELECPEQALEKLGPLLEAAGGRPAGLFLKTRALVALERHDDALTCIDELRTFETDPEWLDLTEAWCLKRVGNLAGAADCMRRMLQRSRRSAIGHFNLGCYLALLGEREEALDELTIACGIDEAFRDIAAEESDLDGLRDHERYVELMGL